MSTDKPSTNLGEYLARRPGLQLEDVVRKLQEDKERGGGGTDSLPEARMKDRSDPSDRKQYDGSLGRREPEPNDTLGLETPRLRTSTDFQRGLEASKAAMDSRKPPP